MVARSTFSKAFRSQNHRVCFGIRLDPRTMELIEQYRVETFAREGFQPTRTEVIEGCVLNFLGKLLNQQKEDLINEQ